MLNEDYIASGILELYAAGGLSETEREEVERHAASSPEVRAALDEACAAMEAYASQYATAPRPELKNRILSQLHDKSTADTPQPVRDETPLRALRPEKTHVPSAYKLMLAASIALFLLSGFLSFHFYTRWQQAEERLAGVIASESLLAQNFQQTSLQLQQQEKVLSILRNPDFKQVKLQAAEGRPNASMLVYWNAAQKQVYIDAVSLPAPPSGKQYQLWALQDGQPIDAGLIALDNTAGIQQMKDISAAQAFAVTLEPVGGSVSPTLETLLVMGTTDS